MTLEHVGDAAELYALGALDAGEAEAYEAHLRLCVNCAAQAAGAERDVALLASIEPRHEAPPELAKRIEGILRTDASGAQARSARFSWPAAAGLAAAFVAGLLPSLYFWDQNQTLRGASLAQSAAMARLAAAPHRMAVFRTAPGVAPAEVAYAPDGSWYVVMVRGASKTLTVAWMHDGERTMLGSAVPHGAVAMLYLPKSHRMNRLALMDGQTIVADAQLTW